jgi:hypothetical protein
MTTKGTGADAVELEAAPVEQQALDSLEDKYREQMRQIFPTRIDLPMLTLTTQIEQQIELRPDFQRRDRWTDEKRSRFIESIVMNVPVPPVFLGEEEYGKYVVLDGRQRLTAAYNFLTNTLRLEGLKVWKELNGLTYAEIKKKGFGATIERRFLPAILLTRESSPEVKYEVFDRLNTGGVKAEPMEVRNAIFPGAFNQALHKLSADPGFRKLWGIPDSQDPPALERNALYREMADLELVLRFFSLREATIKGVRFKDYLSEFMGERNAAYKNQPALEQQDAQVFTRAIQNCITVFGDGAFKKPQALGGRRSAPYADAVMQAMADTDPGALNATTIAAIKGAFEELAGNETFKAAVSTGTNGESAIRDRITLARAAVKTATTGPTAAPPKKAPAKKKTKH